MNNKFEIHILSQIYDFISDREGFKKQTTHLKVQDFFTELHIGDKSDFNILASNKISGNFGKVCHIDLLNVPNFNDKDRFIDWAYKILNQ